MRELFSQTWSNLAANKLRSFLTMFGIMWGLISIVLLSAVGEGFQLGNRAVLREFGKNIVILFGGRTSKQAGGERAGTAIRLDITDVHLLQERSKLLEHITPELARSDIKVKSAFNASSVGVSGVWPIYQEIRTIDLERGRLMTEPDNDQARRVCILGYDTAKQLFAARDPVGSGVTLNGTPYTVIGKMRKKEQDSSYTGPDNGRVFVPYEAMRKDFPLTGAASTPDSLSNIIVAPHESVTQDLQRYIDNGGKFDFNNDGPVEMEIRNILAPHHNFDPSDREAIFIWNTALESVMFTKIIGGMKEFFIAVSIITLALGGIGVMNIMLISVKERTKEIGVRKALGATRGDIMRQFLSEGLLLTLASGAVGFVVGYGLCQLVNLLPMPSRFAGMIVTWQIAVFALATLALIGVAASLYPARQAARLMPVEALRHEM